MYKPEELNSNLSVLQAIIDLILTFEFKNFIYLLIS